MAKILPDLTGTKVGRLQIIRSAGTDSKKYKLYECLCDCGTTKICRAAPLYRGELQSCGCLLKEARNRNLQKAQTAATKHGLAGSLLYQTWNGMMQRCYSPSHDSYPRYGAVGVVVCEFLRATPENLLATVGDRTAARFSLDRMDGKVGYTCGKCPECLSKGWPMNLKWATVEEQALNRKSTVWITIDGVRKTCSQWAKEMGRSCHWVRDHHKPDEK